MLNSDSLPQLTGGELDKMLYAKHLSYEDKDADKITELLTKTMPEQRSNLGERVAFTGIQNNGPRGNEQMFEFMNLL